VTEFIHSLREDTAGNELSNFISLYEGNQTQLDNLVSLALPRSEASNKPALAFSLTHANQQQVVVTFKSNCFAVMDLNIVDPVWLTREAGTEALTKT
jgi:hypothetical protein